MNKRAASLYIAIIGVLGCRNVSPMEGKETHPAICSTAAPTTPEQQSNLKVGPEVPAGKTLAIANEAPKAPPSRESPPREFAPTSAGHSPKDVMENPSDKAAKTVALNREDMSKPQTDSLGRNDLDGPMSASQPQRIFPDNLPRDVWYILATVFGAVFTYILAPVVVDIIRGRIARHHQQVPSIDGSMTYPAHQSVNWSGPQPRSTDTRVRYRGRSGRRAQERNPGVGRYPRRHRSICNAKSFEHTKLSP